MTFKWITNFVDSLKTLLMIPAVWIDSNLYMIVAFFGSWQLSFASDDAEKYITGEMLFWLKGSVASLAATALALKMFRSTQFADHQKLKQNGNTDFIAKQTGP